MRLAIVHDYLNQMGGAERCVQAMHRIWPDAPIYTTLFTPHTMPVIFQNMDIHSTWMQRLPGIEKNFKKYLLLYPRAVAGINLKDFDVILSSSSGWAKGIKKPKGALHICYCYTPMRWVWNYDDYVARERFGPITRAVLPGAINYLRRWDLATNQGIDEIIAISEFVQERIKRVWKRDSTVIYPPVDCSRFQISQYREDYFLVVSRLNSYKKIEMVINACGELSVPLKIIGTGPHEHYLRSIAGPTVDFLGRLDDDTTAGYFSRCKALIFPGEEDFGITPVEAQAAGRPVIAYKGGGAKETVIDGVTGILFDSQTTEDLVDALRLFKKSEFDSQTIRANALKFDYQVFHDRMSEFVDRCYQARKTGT